jgi:hypothetical protein
MQLFPFKLDVFFVPGTDVAKLDIFSTVIEKIRYSSCGTYSTVWHRVKQREICIFRSLIFLPSDYLYISEKM